jgi:hypothetical protein
MLMLADAVVDGVDSVDEKEGGSAAAVRIAQSALTPALFTQMFPVKWSNLPRHNA